MPHISLESIVFDVNKMLKTLSNTILKHYNVSKIITRCTSRKRFYKSCNVIVGNGKYELTLDQRKLRTPKGKAVSIENEPLALAVAAEWNAQKDQINQSNMHLTGLCFTAIDNPDGLTEEKIADELTNYLENDTILYHATEHQEDLHKVELAEWVPISDWLCERYYIDVRPTQDISGPVIMDEDKKKLRQYFLSYNLWALIGLRFSIEALKSVSLGLACRERHIGVEKAVSLSRLEEDFQSERWGRVEWAHDLSELDTRARVSAGTLFSIVNSSSHLIKTKEAVG